MSREGKIEGIGRLLQYFWSMTSEEGCRRKKCVSTPADVQLELSDRGMSKK